MPKILYSLLCLLILNTMWVPASAATNMVFFENFEGGGPGWSPDNGVWEIGTPTTVGPTACFSSSKCAGTVLNGNYPVYTDSRLVSPSIILPSVASNESINLHFREWHDYSPTTISGLDRGVVQVQVYDPGTGTWSAWQDIALPETYSSPVWSRKGADLSAYAGKKIRLGFWHFDNDLANVAYSLVAPGWYIDDVEIVVKPYQFSGGFETGWGDWFADNGVWEVGTPSIVGPSACHTGTVCAGTILAGNHPPNTASRLIFPDIQLPTVTGLNEIHLRFWDWHQYINIGNRGGQFQIAAYDPATQTWSDWVNQGPMVTASSLVWTQRDIDLTAYAGKKVRLAFQHSPFNNGGYNAQLYVALGWYIDDVQIITTPVANPYTMVQSIQVADLNGNGMPEEATLYQNNTTGTLQVSIRDASTKVLVKQIYFGSNFVALGLAEVPDLNHDGYSEIAVMYRNGITGAVYAAVRDVLTGALIKKISFGVLLAQSVAAMEDTDGNGVPEIAVMSLISSSNTYRLDVRDALTGAYVRSIGLP